jgi:hypothetical protein
MTKTVKGIVKVDWTCPNCETVHEGMKPDILAEIEWERGAEDAYPIPLPIVYVACHNCGKTYQVENP